MPTYKLDAWDNDQETFILIGIFATLAPYRMAYLTNKYLDWSLTRSDTDQDVVRNKQVAKFPVYSCVDSVNDATSYLIPNKHWITIDNNASSGLFQSLQENEIKTTFLKEFASVDFIIKIEKEPDDLDIKLILDQLIKIPNVISALQLDSFKIKKTDYLIFK